MRLGTIDELNQLAHQLRRTDASQARELGQEALVRAEAFAYPTGRMRALGALADCALDAADYPAATRYAQEARALAGTHGVSQLEAQMGVVLGICETRCGNFAAALKLLEQSLGQYRSLGQRRGEAEALMYSGGVSIDRAAYAEARDYLQHALAIFEAEGDAAGQMQVLLMLGIALGALGETAAALRANLSALELSEAAGDLLTQARVLNNLGSAYDTRGDGDKALESYLQALRLAERLGNPQLRAMLLANLAEVYARAGELTRAVAYAHESLAIEEANGYLRGQGETLATLGKLYGLQDDHAAAERSFKAALRAAQAAEDPYTQASVLGSLADLERRRGRREAALELFGRSIATAQATEIQEVEIDARLGLGQLLADLRDEPAARRELTRAAELATRFGFKRQRASAYLALSESLERDGDVAAAFACYKQHTETVRDLSSERIAERTRTLMGRLELEQAEKTAALERFKNHELAAANAALRTTLAENSALLAQLREQAARLEQQNREDALTGAANRRYLEEQLYSIFETAQRHAQPLCVAMIDIDDFKRVNDTLSHQVGDEVLRQVAQIFSRFVRLGDLVARYGGEEFVIVFPQTTLAGGRAVCERICQAVAAHPWPELHPELSVTLSIGVSAELGVKDHEKLLMLADAKLYEAKRAGKNRVVG